MKPKQNKNIEKTQNRADPTTARPCIGVRPTVRHPRTAVRHQCTAVHGLCQFRLLLPGVHGRAPLWHARALPVFRCFAILGARGFLKPLIFLEIAREVFFSIET